MGLLFRPDQSPSRGHYIGRIRDISTDLFSPLKTPDRLNIHHRALQPHGWSTSKRPDNSSTLVPVSHCYLIACIRPNRAAVTFDNSGRSASMEKNRILCMVGYFFFHFTMQKVYLYLVRVREILGNRVRIKLEVSMATKSLK